MSTTNAIRWAEALRVAQPARAIWSRAARAQWLYSDDEPLSQLATWLSEVIAMATLESAYAQAEWLQGQTDAALASFHDLVLIGRRLSGGGPLIQVLGGWEVTEEALRCARRLARLASNESEIKTILHTLGDLEPFTETATEGFRVETVALLNMAQQILSVLWVGHPPVPGAPRLPGQVRELNRRLLARLGSEPSGTQRRIVAAMSLLMVALRDPAAAESYEALRQQVRAPSALLDDPVATLLLRAFLPDVTALRHRMQQMAEEAAATRWVLAVQHFALANGRMPASLEEAASAFDQAGVERPATGRLSLLVRGASWFVAGDRGRAYGLTDAPAP